MHHTRTRAATQRLALSLSLSRALPLSLYLSSIRQCSDCSRTQNLKDFPPHTGTETLETPTPRSRGVPNPNHSRREGECVYLVAVYARVCACMCVHPCEFTAEEATLQIHRPEGLPIPLPSPISASSSSPSIHPSLLGYPLRSSSCVCVFMRVNWCNQTWAQQLDWRIFLFLPRIVCSFQDRPLLHETITLK